MSWKITHGLQISLKKRLHQLTTYKRKKGNLPKITLLGLINEICMGSKPRN